MTRPLPAIRPGKGDFVKGHKAVVVFADVDAPAIRGRIADVSPSGHAVTFEISAGMAMLGLPRLSTWTWREKNQTWQQKGARAVDGEGLVLITDRRAA